jgi:CheY-like chemotaxis protein
MEDKAGPLILMVEDDQLLASIIGRRFIAESFRVEHAASGEEALRLLQAENAAKPDLLLLDIHLTGMSGFEFLEQVRSSPITVKLPVIVLSNFNEPADLERSKQLGVLQHIQKVSLEPAEVVEVVRNAIKNTARTP